MSKLSVCWDSLKARFARLRDTLYQATLVKKIRNSKVVAVCSAHPIMVQALLILIYRLLFDAVYLTIIAPHYAHFGFTNQLHPLRYGVSLLTTLLFAPAVAWHQQQKYASATLLTIINYLLFIPMTCFYGCSGLDYVFYLIAIGYWAMLLLFQAIIPVLTAKPFPTKCSKWLFPVLTVGAVALIVFISGKYTGFRLNLDIINVYGIRAESAKYEMSGMLSYGLSMLPCVLAVLLLYWLKHKKYLISLLLCIAFLFLFSINAHKSTFFMLILVVGCWIVFRPWMVKWIGGLLALGLVGALLEYEFLGGTFIAYVLFRRVCLLPTYLSAQYMKFFSENPLNLFRDGIFGRLSFEPIYSTSIPNLLGEFEGHYENANNGLLGDMFANLPPVLGVVFMPLLIIMMLRLFDMFSANVNKKVLFPFCVIYGIFFMSTSWSTVLLSNGFLLLCVLLYLFPKEDNLAL